jgi:hypothetical protein
MTSPELFHLAKFAFAYRQELPAGQKWVFLLPFSPFSAILGSDRKSLI